MTLQIPPEVDEFEVSVFGPGRGECILIHLGYNEWCMVDSCVGPGSSRPAAVEYLGGFGQKALEGVLLVLATHWHDDHIRGIGAAIREFPNAEFACSMALQTGHFATLVKLATKVVHGNSGVDEFGKFSTLLMERKERGPASQLGNAEMGASRSNIAQSGQSGPRILGNDLPLSAHRMEL